MLELPKVHNVEECPGCKVPKGWGHEIVFENNEMCCGKLLCFHQRDCLSKRCGWCW